jgi:flagellar FliJ protein
MRKFTFDLEQVLRMKRWREEDAKKALAVEVAALEQLKSRLLELQGDLKELWDGDAQGDGPVIDHRGRLGILQYARHVGTLISGQEGDISEQGKRLKEKSDLLLKAMQERKVLEKLKERRKSEYRVERNRFEYANLDEASARYLRRLADRENSLKEEIGQ